MPNPSKLIGLKTEILSILNEFKDEVKNFYATGLVEYIEDRNNKFSVTNTFLNRVEKVNFYDVYFELTLANSDFTLKQKRI